MANGNLTLSHRIEVEFAELHSPLFLNGMNLGTKLSDKEPRLRGIHLCYSEDTRHLYVTWKGKTARVPEPSILSMVEKSAEVIIMKAEPEPVAPPAPRASAQVSSPQAHVFEGPGKGRSR